MALTPRLGTPSLGGGGTSQGGSSQEGYALAAQGLLQLGETIARNRRNKILDSFQADVTQAYRGALEENPDNILSNSTYNTLNNSYNALAGASSGTEGEVTQQQQDLQGSVVAQTLTERIQSLDMLRRQRHGRTKEARLQAQALLAQAITERPRMYQDFANIVSMVDATHQGQLAMFDAADQALQVNAQSLYDGIITQAQEYGIDVNLYPPGSAEFSNLYLQRSQQELALAFTTAQSEIINNRNNINYTRDVNEANLTINAMTDDFLESLKGTIEQLNSFSADQLRAFQEGQPIFAQNPDGTMQEMPVSFQDILAMVIGFQNDIADVGSTYSALNKDVKASVDDTVTRLTGYIQTMYESLSTAEDKYASLSLMTDSLEDLYFNNLPRDLKNLTFYVSNFGNFLTDLSQAEGPEARTLSESILRALQTNMRRFDDFGLNVTYETYDPQNAPTQQPQNAVPTSRLGDEFSELRTNSPGMDRPQAATYQEALDTNFANMQGLLNIYSNPENGTPGTWYAGRRSATGMTLAQIDYMLETVTQAPNGTLTEDIVDKNLVEIYDPNNINIYNQTDLVNALSERLTELDVRITQPRLELIKQKVQDFNGRWADIISKMPEGSNTFAIQVNQGTGEIAVDFSQEFVNSFNTARGESLTQSSARSSWALGNGREVREQLEFVLNNEIRSKIGRNFLRPGLVITDEMLADIDYARVLDSILNGTELPGIPRVSTVDYY